MIKMKAMVHWSASKMGLTDAKETGRTDMAKNNEPKLMAKTRQTKGNKFPN
jgi:hypothetical protein